MKTQYKSLFLLFLICIQNSQFILAQNSNEDGEAEQADNDYKDPSGDVPVTGEVEPEIVDGFTTNERRELEAKSEKHEFQAEVGRLMDILINSLYTHKEIFLREVISNAADALDKIRFLSVSNPEVLGDQSELAIRIEFDDKAKTLSITDTGIGMTKQELISNLGTIAKSGTTAFVQHLAKEGSLNLIGQFGVGFYSTFLAANKVTVTSKNNEDEQWIWESSAASLFAVVKDPRGDTLKRGTRVTLHLKQDAYEFCEQDRIRGLVKKYSEFINFPIYLKISKEVTKEVPIEEEAPIKEEGEDEEKTTEEGEEKKEDDLEVKDETDEKVEEKPKTKTVRETVFDWELVNDSKALWLRSKEDIEEEEYTKFYKSLSKDYDDPLTHIHFQAEGEVEFKSILYIPKHAPNDMFENYHGKSSSLKLYVRRVLINEEFEDLMPRYLSFIKGIVDSDDLPLNVNRESLQQLKMLKVMSRKLVRKTLEMIQKLEDYDDDEDEDEDEEGEDTEEENNNEEKGEDTDETQDAERKEQAKEKKREERRERYRTFWKEFGKSIKLGIIEDPGNRSKLAKLARWYSSANISKITSFDEYIERMKEGQESIYFIAGENKETLIKSPTIQGLLKRGYEVLLLDDPIDEFCVQNLQEYEKKKLVNTAKGDFKMPEDDIEKKKLKKLKKIYQPLTDWWKKTDTQHIDSVVVTQRLTEDPVVIVATEYGHSANMERISKAQAYGQSAGPGPQKRILEINPHHPIIKELLERVKDGADEETEDMAKLLYEAALLNSGYSLGEPASFAKRFYKIFNGALGIPKDAEVVEVEVDVEDEDEEEEEDRRRRRRRDDDDDDEESRGGQGSDDEEDSNDDSNNDNEDDGDDNNDNADEGEQGGRDPDEL